MDVLSYIFNLLPIVASSSDDGNSAALVPLVLCLSGFIFYFYIVSRYRNADKRHSYEKETEATVANLGVHDKLVKNQKGLSNPSMSGANHNRVEGALNQGGASNNLLNMFKE